MKTEYNQHPICMINLGELGMWSTNTLAAQCEHRTKGMSGYSEWFVPLIDTKYHSLQDEYTEAIKHIKQTKILLPMKARVSGILNLYEFNKQIARITQANTKLENLIKQRDKLEADYTAMLTICEKL